MAKSIPIHHEQPLGFKVWRGAINRMSRAHQHNDLEINMLLHGQATYLHGGRLFDLNVGAMSLFWAAIPHQIIKKSTDTRMAWITLPLDWLWKCDCSSGLLTKILTGQMITDIQPEQQDDTSLRSWQTYCSQDDPRWQHIASLEVEARLRRFMIANQSSANPKRKIRKRQTEKSALDPVQMMADYLSSHFDQPIGVEDVAKQVRLHPNYAMRLFSKHMNMTMIQYLTQQRIAEARRLLITSDLPVLDIVFECGFGSTSQFYQAFETYVGQTPRAFRKQLMMGEP
ncbi:MAG TPA: hypothetical protein DCM28_00980 [Phycisphaerales bacterium]|nr:hypothetical protein [Phycisphaerales bacterium]HCD32376.1 hypothetical protein [Phycisphaerales bacterium]|tara:strand:+ start:1167 stop:2018 length:852 start_codon:yes stop_codon:yes gene_type:complete